MLYASDLGDYNGDGIGDFGIVYRQVNGTPGGICVVSGARGQTAAARDWALFE